MISAAPTVRAGARRSLALWSTRGGTKSAANRVGYTVSNKLGCAVVRNRVRRRLREIYRLNERRFRPGYDIVVVARGRSVSADYGSLERDFLRACAALGLLVKEEGKAEP